MRIRPDKCTTTKCGLTVSENVRLRSLGYLPKGSLTKHETQLLATLLSCRAELPCANVARMPPILRRNFQGQNETVTQRNRKGGTPRLTPCHRSLHSAHHLLLAAHILRSYSLRQLLSVAVRRFVENRLGDTRRCGCLGRTCYHPHQKALVVREPYVSKRTTCSTSFSLIPLSGFVQTICGI